MPTDPEQFSGTATPTSVSSRRHVQEHQHRSRARGHARHVDIAVQAVLVADHQRVVVTPPGPPTTRTWPRPAANPTASQDGSEQPSPDTVPRTAPDDIYTTDGSVEAIARTASTATDTQAAARVTTPVSVTQEPSARTSPTAATTTHAIQSSRPNRMNTLP